MSSYIRKPIGEVCTIRRGASPRPIDEWMSNSGMPWVKISDATKEDSRFIKETEGYIREEGKNRSVEVFPGDLIISNSATPALPKIMKINACIHDGWLLTRDFNGVTRDYLYYQVKYLQKFLVNQGSGSIFKNLKTDILKEFPIIIPVDDNGEMDVSKQERITKVLENIEDKIELNNKINSELEAIAKELYEYRFVQFDFPDENGRPYKSSGGKMVWSEELKRDIPMRWEAVPLSEVLILLKDGTHNPPKRIEKGIPLLTGTMFGQNFLDYSQATFISENDYQTIHSQYAPQASDIVLTKIGTLGNVNYLRKSDIPIAVHCNSALLRFPDYLAGMFSLRYCKSKEFQKRLRAAKGQSIQEFCSLDGIGSILMLVPDKEVTNIYNKKMYPVLCNMERISEENQKLIELRDFLLPMLMNGQVTVK